MFVLFPLRASVEKLACHLKGKKKGEKSEKTMCLT